MQGPFLATKDKVTSSNTQTRVSITARYPDMSNRSGLRERRVQRLGGQVLLEMVWELPPGTVPRSAAGRQDLAMRFAADVARLANIDLAAVTVLEVRAESDEVTSTRDAAAGSVVTGRAFSTLCRSRKAVTFSSTRLHSYVRVVYFRILVSYFTRLR